jgi:D-3-phosphoglycerate dehydrogenase/C-terminal binding protein
LPIASASDFVKQFTSVTIEAPIPRDRRLFSFALLDAMSNLPRVVITDFVSDALEPERRVLDGVASITAAGAHSEADLAGKIEDAVALMAFHCLSLSRATIDRLAACKLIVRCGVGFDNVDHAYARSRGIAVANVPDYGTEEVADSAIGMLLALTRGIAFFNNYYRPPARDWLYTAAGPLYRLRGRTLGIVGLGRIGTATALRAKALGLNVSFYDPYVRDGTDKAIGVRRVESLDDLLSHSHVLSVHCPLTDETRHMINAAALARLPRGSFLVNTARGAIVDTSAVAPAWPAANSPAPPSTCCLASRRRTTIPCWLLGAIRHIRPTIG